MRAGISPSFLYYQRSVYCTPRACASRDLVMSSASSRQKYIVIDFASFSAGVYRFVLPSPSARQRDADTTMPLLHNNIDGGRAN